MQDTLVDTMGERLAIALAKTGYTQSKLARKLCGNDATVEQLNSVKSKINALIRRKSQFSSLTGNISEIMGISRDWLENGRGDMLDFDTPKNQLLEQVIAHDISFNFCEIKGFLRMTNADKMLINLVKIEQPTHKIAVMNATADTICYQMRGSDLQPAIFDSWIVAADPTLTPKSGELMLATIANDNVIIGIYLYDRANSITVQNLKTGELSTIDRADIVQIMPVTAIAMPSQMQPI